MRRVCTAFGTTSLTLLLTACQQHVPQKAQASELVGADKPYVSKKSSLNYGIGNANQATGSIDQQSEDISANDEEDSNLWGITRENLELKRFYNNPRVLEQREWYQHYTAYIEKTSEQAAPFYYHVLSQVLARGMPSEIALLPFIESAYNPLAVSPSNATGPWQFVSGTAEHLGMKRNSWYDARRDILDSTQAALNYLQVLSDRYNGDWLLALAAYNAGEGTIDNAIASNSSKGEGTDYWSLHLRQETEQYVPRLLALASLINHPQKYDIALPELSNTPYFAIVKTSGQIDLKTAANLAGIPWSEIKALNPGYTSNVTAPKGEGPGRLIVPVDAAEPLRIGLSTLPRDQRLNWSHYIVRRGDNLGAIASNYNTSVKALRDVNNLSSNLLHVGDQLMIPGTSGNSAGLIASAATSSSSVTKYRVKAGDNLSTIADKHGTSVADLAKLNKLNPKAPLKIGQTLNLKALRSDTALAKVNYRVKSGDSLSVIAEQYKVSIQALKSWNGLKSQSIRVGQSLTIYPSETASNTGADGNDS
ncbi:LysM peptidoglycan-binding domain-containing protein [Pokkaliibacter sp. CJK22405]|uniref:LysM peptidoglycan-binding domain-containing protein n=1 Tax=Pokkaliibacter sp. CJK22405 TaxID=3384615 RepID=UPI003984CEDC